MLESGIVSWIQAWPWHAKTSSGLIPALPQRIYLAARQDIAHELHDALQRTQSKIQSLAAHHQEHILHFPNSMDFRP